GELDAVCHQRLHAAGRELHVADDGGFGDLEADGLAGYTGALEDGEHTIGEVGMQELRRTEVHRDPRIGSGPPRRGLPAYRLQRPLAQLVDEPTVLGRGDDLGGCHRTEFG